MRTSPGERLIFSTRFSKRIFVRPMVFVAVCIAMMAVFRAIPRWADLPPEGHDALRYVSYALAALAGLALIAPLTKYFLSEFVITNKRVVIRHGLIARRSYDMLLKKIESVGVNQGLSDQVWGRVRWSLREQA